MHLTVQAVPFSDAAVLSSHGGGRPPLPYQPTDENLHLRIVPGTVIGAGRVPSDGRGRPADAGRMTLRAPSRLLAHMDAFLVGERPTGWTRQVFGGSAWGVHLPWMVGAQPLYAGLERGAFPGSHALVMRRLNSLVQLGSTQLSARLDTREAGWDPEEAYGPAFAHLEAQHGARPWHDFGVPASGDLSLPDRLAHSLVYLRTDERWHPEGVQQLLTFNDRLTASHQGTAIEAHLNTVVIHKRLGHPGEPQVSLAAQTLYIFGDGRQVPARTPEGVRTFAMPPGMTFVHLAPSGADLSGSLQDAISTKAFHAAHRYTSDGTELSIGNTRPVATFHPASTPTDLTPAAPTFRLGRVDDLRFSTPAFRGRVDAFDPRLPLAAGDIAFVAADHPEAAIAVPRPGRSVYASQILEDLAAHELRFNRVVFVSGRARADDPQPPVHALLDNPLRDDEVSP